MADSTIQMMPRRPDRVPKQKAETAEATGIPKARQLTTKAAMTPNSAAYGAEMPRCRLPSLSRCGCRAMK